MSFIRNKKQMHESLLCFFYEFTKLYVCVGVYIYMLFSNRSRISDELCINNNKKKKKKKFRITRGDGTIG